VKQAKGELAVGSEAMMKNKMKDLNLEGGSVRLSTSQSGENLKMLDDSIKGLSKLDADKLKKDL
jgi:hypothetical protein